MSLPGIIIALVVLGIPASVFLAAYSKAEKIHFRKPNTTIKAAINKWSRYYKLANILYAGIFLSIFIGFLIQGFIVKSALSNRRNASEAILEQSGFPILIFIIVGPVFLLTLGILFHRQARRICKDNGFTTSKVLKKEVDLT